MKVICLPFLFPSCSLEELGPECDNVVLAFKQLAQEFEEKFKEAFNYGIWEEIKNVGMIYFWKSFRTTGRNKLLSLFIVQLLTEI